MISAKFTKEFKTGVIRDKDVPNSYTIAVGGESFTVPYTQIHAKGIRFPETILCKDGSLRRGSSIELVGIVREALPVSWRPSHEKYLVGADPAKSDSRAAGAPASCASSVVSPSASFSDDDEISESSYKSLLREALAEGRIEQMLLNSILAYIDGNLEYAVVFLKMHLGRKVTYSR